MKKYLIILAVMVFSIYIFGCGKKEAALEEGQEQMTLETLATVNTTAPVAPAVQATPISQAKLEPLPPAGPYKPTAAEIQTALKNAGFYTGEVDSKIGPKTKKALEEFQKANNLKADGKVGPKTWAALSKYLNPEPSAATAAPAKKKR
jgi:peptidoglycan hydrolase-like protein with peptidoglycan-binding domain